MHNALILAVFSSRSIPSVTAVGIDELRLLAPSLHTDWLFLYVFVFVLFFNKCPFITVLLQGLFPFLHA